VIHWQHPASAEDYLQELGRVGRDGRRSVAFLLRDFRPDGPTLRLLDFMAQRTAEAASNASDERGRLLNRRRALAFSRTASAAGCSTTLVRHGYRGGSQ